MTRIVWILVVGSASQILGGTRGPELVLVPTNPTSADVIEILVNGGGSGAPALVSRVSSTTEDPTSIANILFERLRDPDEQATLLVGVLAPGRYSFIAYHSGGNGPGCFNDSVAGLHFTVFAAPKSGSGRLALVIDSRDDAVIDDVIEAMNPSPRHFFASLGMGTVDIPLGLAASYAELFAASAGVVDVDLGGVGEAGCDPPLPSFDTQSLSLSLATDVDLLAFDALIRVQLPEREHRRDRELFDTGKARGESYVQVRVPIGWEPYLLDRYLDDARVRRGHVILSRTRFRGSAPPATR